MSLITRCPVCETMFKVVADQFKVAQGWVRCGYCGEVFDAAQHLVSEESGTPVASAPDGMLALETSPQGAPDTQSSPLPPVESAQKPVELAQKPVDALPDALLTVPDMSDVPVLASVPEQAASGEDASLMTPDDAAALAPQAIELSQAAAPPLEVPTVQDLPTQESPVQELPEARLPDSAAPADDQPADQPLSPAPDAPVDAVLPEPEVSFVRDARRKAFWARPLVRGFLGLLSLALLAALLLQWMLQHRDTLVAKNPQLAPLLQALCNPLKCEIRPPRQIESLVIESSSFSKIAPDVYRLSFVLKNTSAIALQIPSIEVTLTNIQEQALVRRVLAPREFAARVVTLAAHAELTGALTLRVAAEPALAASPSQPLPVNGYRILAFYP